MGKNSYDKLSARMRWAIAEMPTTAQVEKICAAMDETRDIKVECKVNGVEVNFERLLNSLLDAHDHYVNGVAKEIIRERLGEMEAKFDDLFQKYKDEVKAKFPEFDWEER